MGNFYRPPHTTVAQLKPFIKYFSQKLTELNSNNIAFVCGDYNINLLSVDSDEHSGSYFYGVLSSGLGSSTDDQVLKYTKYHKYIPSTSTGQVLVFLKKVLKYIKYFHIKYKYSY